MTLHYDDGGTRIISTRDLNWLRKIILLFADGLVTDCHFMHTVQIDIYKHTIASDLAAVSVFALQRTCVLNAVD